MRSLFVLLATVLTVAIAAATALTAKNLVAQLYQAHHSSQDPLVETQFAGPLLRRPAAQAISPPKTAGGETQVTVGFKNLGKPTRIVYVLTHTGAAWRISDIRYDDGSSLKKILQADQ